MCNANRFQNLTNGYITNYKDEYAFQEIMLLECENGYEPINRLRAVVCSKPSSFDHIELPDFGCKGIGKLITLVVYV